MNVLAPKQLRRQKIHWCMDLLWRLGLHLSHREFPWFEIHSHPIVFNDFYQNKSNFLKIPQTSFHLLHFNTSLY